MSHNIKDYYIFDTENPKDFMTRLKDTNGFSFTEMRDHVIEETLLRDLSQSETLEDLKKVIKKIILTSRYK